MKSFGPAYGNFPTLNYPASRIPKLTGSEQASFYMHWPHNSIRKAWLEAARTSRDVASVLNLITANEYALFCEVQGNVLTEDGLHEWLERTQRNHELAVCFGLFLQSEVDHLIKNGKAGPILRRSPGYKQLQEKKGSLHPYCGVLILRELLNDYRDKADALTRETATFAARIAKRDHCLDSVPEAVKMHFYEAHNWFEAAKANAAMKSSMHV